MNWVDFNVKLGWLEELKKAGVLDENTYFKVRNYLYQTAVEELRNEVG